MGIYLCMRAYVYTCIHVRIPMTTVNYNHRMARARHAWCPYQRQGAGPGHVVDMIMHTVHTAMHVLGKRQRSPALAIVRLSTALLLSGSWPVCHGAFVSACTFCVRTVRISVACIATLV